MGQAIAAFKPNQTKPKQTPLCAWLMQLLQDSGVSAVKPFSSITVLGLDSGKAQC